MSEPAAQTAAPSAAAAFGRRLWHFLGALLHRFFEDRGVQTAGSLTFTTLLSLVPLLTVALSLATAFPVFREGTAASVVQTHHSLRL